MKTSEYKTDPKLFKSRFNKAKAIRAPWESLLRETYDLFLPERDAFNGDSLNNSSRGQKHSTKVFDDTGAQSLQQFVNQLKNKLLPSQERFTKFVPSGKTRVDMINGLFEEEDEKELQIQLDKNNDILFHYLWESNMDSAILESLQDMAISTGALMIQETGDVDSPFNFISIPADQLIIEESNTGVVNNVWREWSLKAEEIPHLWPDYVKDDKIEKIICDKPTNKIHVIEGTIWNKEENKFDYCVYTESAGCKFIFESKYKVSPYVIFRWNKSPNETWGRGPAINCQPTMSTLNRLVSDLLRNNAMHINPPMVISSDGFVNPSRIKIAPNSRIITKSSWTGNTAPISYLQSATNFNLGTGMRSEYQQQVREAFYLNFFGGIDDPVRSATEISIRNQQMLEQQTSAFTRLKTELIDQIIKRSYYILQRMGLVQDLQLGNGVVSIKAISPLAQTQDMRDIEAISRYFQAMMGLAGEQGMALAALEVDVESIPSFYADKFGVPAALRMDDKKKKAQAQLLQQAMVAQQGLPPQQ
jgi:hypothetical protein